MWSLPIYFLGFLTAVVVLSYSITIARLLGVRLRRHRTIRLTDRSEMPEDIAEALSAYGAQLEDLGFEPAGALSEAYFVEDVDEPVWSLVYVHRGVYRERRSGTSSERAPECETMARISLAESPTRAQPVDVSFLSFVSSLDERGESGEGAQGEEKLVETVAWRAHRLAAGLPGHRLIDARTLCWKKQWREHRAALSRAGASVRTDDASAFVDRYAAFRARAQDFEIIEGRQLARPDGSLRFGLRNALDTVWRANKGEGARLKALAAAAA